MVGSVVLILKEMHDWVGSPAVEPQIAVVASTAGVVIIIVAIYFPTRHARNYSYIPTNRIYKEIVLLKTENQIHNLNRCTYEDLILKNKNIEITSVTEKKEFPKAFSRSKILKAWSNQKVCSNRYCEPSENDPQH
ncbi:hypothetical protein NQ317_011087 [Molorchus minor]|uniref:Uncharacterized protein n=1 Tax=Molorchus minor TaxID=1323400 RepID=A0ABQ9JWX4_9CUCU|nr:hypothetical protein NQ317_011087 [Molorchus minor]